VNFPIQSDAWGLCATGLTSVTLGLFVYSRNREGELQLSWLRLCLATAFWTLATSLLISAPSMGWAFFWVRVAQVAFSLVPAYFLQFSLTLLGEEGGHQRLLRWNRWCAVTFGLLAVTPLMIRDLQMDAPFKFYPVAGPFYGVFALWFLSTFVVALWILLKAYKTQIGYRRNQLMYVILASCIGLTAFLSMIPIVFGIPVPPMAPLLLVFYALISYTIIRWRLMDISIVIKNTLIYASLYSVLVGLFVVVVVFLGQLFFYGPQALDKRVLWMCAVALSIVTALVRPLDNWLKRLTDQMLFQRKYEWQKTVKEVSKGMTQVASVDRLLKLMAHFIGMRVRVTQVGIFYRTGDSYILKVSRGREKRPVGLALHRDNPLVTWLEEKREVLTVENLHDWLRNEKMFPSRSLFRKNLDQIESEMDSIRVRMCVPAFSKSRMLGFLVLGEKLSGDPYSQEDIDLLSTLANEGAIALENAQLYEQLYQRMHEIENLYLREHHLFIHTAIALAAAVDARDPYTHGHTERCTAYALAIAEEMGSHPEIADNSRFKEMVKIAALLHDIGKIGTPDEILRKKGKLTPKEFKKMEEHPTVGAIILQPIKGMEEVAKAVRSHHERYDGKGYPEALRGAEIPLITRVISVADTFDAMTTDRPYRKRLSDEAALKEIQECSGTQFDPVVVEAFMRVYRKGSITLRPFEAAEMLA